MNILLKAGADPDIRDIDGRTPLSYAVETGREGVIKILEAHLRGRTIEDAG